jgi:two-component sensor histidine kinase
MTEADTHAGADLGCGAANGPATLLVAELQHRIKNVFAVIHALALRSLNGDSPLEEAREAFIGRLEALARADQRLLDSAWKGTSLSDLVGSELEPFSDRIEVDGVDVILTPRAAPSFALALHELATNTSKYGALSVPGGVVAVGWIVSADDGAGTLRFRWQERGGPLVSVPKRTEFGTSLLQAALGEGWLEYAIEGLTYKADVPLAMIVAREPLATDGLLDRLDRDHRLFTGGA